MTFLFDCPDEICLPKAYRLADEVKPFIDKIKQVEVKPEEVPDRKGLFKLMLENMMVKYPRDTGELFAKLWVLEEGESAPNTFKTMATLFANEVAVDFFTSVLPSLLQLSKGVLPLLTSASSGSMAGTTSKTGA